MNGGNNNAASKNNPQQNNSSSSSLCQRLTQFVSSWRFWTTSSAKKSAQYQSNNNNKIFIPNYQNIQMSPQSVSANDLDLSNPPGRRKPLDSHDVITINNGTIQLRRGDITKQTVDAIVIASSSDDLRNSVLRAAGDSIKTAYDTEHRQNPSKSICTNGGNLGCKRIYFIPCSKLSQATDKWVFRTFISDTITLATQDSTTRIQSIGIPAIGCGRYGCDPDLVAKALISGAAYELEVQPSLHFDVHFIIQSHQHDIFDAFKKRMTKLRNKILKCDSSQDVVTLVPSPRISEQYNLKQEFTIDKCLLNDSSSEYTKIMNLFWSTMAATNCKKIVRVEIIWNKCWYDQYMTHKAAFSQRLKENTEKQLFHGCSEDAANSIIQKYFDRSYAGKHGTSYGCGVYFSSSANYSHSYTVPNTKGERCMFLSRVLIGKSTRGNSSMKICPIGYDSTTDGSHIYVVYCDTQAFGQYLITYK